MSRFRRRQMLAAAQRTSDIIYELYNHVCNGTASTCIDTGIKMLSQAFMQKHPKIQIELSYISDSSNAAKAHILRCNMVNAIIAAYPGFLIRANASRNAYSIKWQPIGGPSVFEEDTNSISSSNLIITFDFLNCGFRVVNRDGNGSDESVSYSSMLDFDTIPLTIGGSVTNGVDASGGWKEMWKGTITSLVIKDIV